MKLVLFVVLVFLTCCSDPPKITEFTDDQIDVTQEPFQERIDGQVFPAQGGDYIFTITPVAEYEIHAEVKSARNYSSGWESLLSPRDLALAWGNLTLDGVDDHISYSQSNRWYYYEYTGSFPYDPSYIISHSANNHILPATDNVKKAIYSIGKNSHVRLKGYLVNVIGADSSGNSVWWNSSLSRGDTGNGACEVFWVNEVQIENKIYK